MKRTLVFALVFVLVLIFLLLKPVQEKTIYFYSGGKNVTLLVKIADTDETRTKGLMFVESLDNYKGMLFVFDDEAKRTFWTKNTLIPLDMIFVAANGTVVGVVEDAKPCNENPCQTYSVNAASRYVVEANAGFARENKIAEGTFFPNNLYKGDG